MPRLIELRLLAIDQDIAKCVEKLRGLYMDKQDFIQRKEAEKNRASLEREVPIEVEWKRIRNKKLIKRLVWIDEALHVETRGIIATYKGKRFKFGRFMFRLPVGGTPAVWALKSTHPNRIAHPHISEKGIVCYGNIAAPLAQAAGECRIADELDMLFGWLIEGYDPAVADTKIEEWPQVRRKSKGRKTQ